MKEKHHPLPIVSSYLSRKILCHSRGGADPTSRLGLNRDRISVGLCKERAGIFFVLFSLVGSRPAASCLRLFRLVLDSCRDQDQLGQIGEHETGKQAPRDLGLRPVATGDVE